MARSNGTRKSALEWGLLLFILLFFVLFALLALQFSGRARWVPLGTSLPGIVLCVWALRRESAPRKAAASHFRGLLSLTASLIVALGIAIVGGFLFAVPAAYLVFALASEGRRRVGMALLISLVATLVAYLLFGIMLRMPVTRGLL